MRFLQDSDYLKQIKQNVLDQILNDDYTLLLDVERSSILEVSGYIGVRYDRTKIFSVLKEYDSSISYSLDARVKYIEPDYETGVVYGIGYRVDWTDGYIYTAIQETTGAEDPTDLAYWTQLQESGLLYYVIDENGTTAGSKPDVATTEYTLGDTRNPLIVRMLIDIILFHLVSRINPRNIPELRVTRYDEAKTMLDQINKGALMGYDLPANEDTTEYSNTIVTGSSREVKTSTYY
jgi:hypothetical protein